MLGHYIRCVNKALFQSAFLVGVRNLFPTATYPAGLVGVRNLFPTATYPAGLVGVRNLFPTATYPAGLVGVRNLFPTATYPAGLVGVRNLFPTATYPAGLVGVRNLFPTATYPAGLVGVRKVLLTAIYPLGLMLAVFALPSAAQAALCPTDRIEEQVQVGKVVDGDTLLLSDGRKLRVIGINTPELAHEERPAEPLAVTATQFVQDQIDKQPQINLRFDEQRHDKYGRMLAHVFLADGNSLSALLARHGYGQAVNIAPNNWNSACYFAQDNDARQHRRGVWKLPRYLPVEARRLTWSTRGFYLVKGKVIRVGKSRQAFWLQLDSTGHPAVAIRVPHKYTRNFNFSVTALLGKNVEARGWLYPVNSRKRKELRMTVTNDDMLKRQ